MKRNYIWAFIDKATQLGISILITKWIAGYFGVELFGAYQFALSTFAIATSLTWLCPAELFYGRIDQNGRLKDVVITTSIIYRFFLSVVIFIFGVSYVVIAVEGSERTAFTVLLLLSLIYAEPLGIFRLLIETCGRYDIASKVRFFGIFLKAALVYITIKIEASPNTIVFVILSESVAVALICCFYYRSIIASYSFKASDWDNELFRVMFREGLRYWPGLVAMTFALKADRIFLAGTLDENTFGSYAAGISLFEQFTSIGTSIVSIAAPIYVYRVGDEYLSKNFKALVPGMVLLSILGACILSAIAPVAVNFIYGPQFDNTVEILRAILLFSPIVFLELIASTLMIKQRSPGFFSIKWIVALIGSLVILKSGDGELHGVYGHGSAWVIASIFSMMFMVRYFSKISITRS